MSFFKALFENVLFIQVKALLTVWISNFYRSQVVVATTFLHKKVCFLIISWKVCCQGLLELNN